MGQPRLRHDGRCRQHGERQCHVKGKDIEQVPERGVRVGLGMDLERQIHEGKGKDGQVPHAEFSCEEVSVEVPDEQNGLEEHQAGEPHMGRTAEVGRQQPARQGLEPEEQDGPREDHARQDDYGQPVISPVPCRFPAPSKHPSKSGTPYRFSDCSSRDFFTGKRLEWWNTGMMECWVYDDSITPYSIPAQGCRRVKGSVRRCSRLRRDGSRKLASPMTIPSWPFSGWGR